MRWDGWMAWWLVMPFVMFGTWAVVIWAAATFLRPHRGATPVDRQDRSGPEAILADRFARGEIDDHEYHLRLATWRGHQESSPR